MGKEIVQVLEVVARGYKTGLVWEEATVKIGSELKSFDVIATFCRGIVS